MLGLVAVLGAAAAAVWLAEYESRGKYLQSTDDAYVAADIVTVSPKVSGYVDQVYVTDNEDVSSGQPLVRIDPRDYQAQTAQYKAQLDVANASVANVRASLREQEAAIAEARAQLASAQSDERYAAGEVVRYEPLVETGAETREKLASLREQAARSEAGAAAQRATLVAAQRRIETLKAQIRQSLAQGDVVHAQLSTADVNLQSTIVRASLAGRVGDKGVQLGQFVQSGTRMMSVVPLSGVYVSANFKETQIGHMLAGQPAIVRVDALPGVTLKGHVESISPGTGSQFSLLPPQNATGNFTKIVQRVPVRIAIDAGPAERRVLVPGLSVSVQVDTRVPDAAGKTRDEAR